MRTSMRWRTASSPPSFTAPRRRGVERIVAIGGNSAANARVAGLVAAHPDRLWGAIGYDRDQAGRSDAPAPGWEAALDAPGIVAVGECGLDYHYRPDTAPVQRALFEIDGCRRRAARSAAGRAHPRGR
jgi:TatD DNase family protein